MTEISAIMTFHREGLLAGPSIGSYLDALQVAKDAGLSVEAILVLDRSDDATRAMTHAAEAWAPAVHETDFGDPGLTRNGGVEFARGKYVTFLDGDDLWTSNWLVAAHAFCEAQTKPTIAHSAFNVVFGGERNLWVHQDSEDPALDLEYLQVGNYWDAMAFGARDIYRKFPFKKNELAQGYGHEDWHWNMVTIAHGIAHRPVPGTAHFKRRRHGSQSARANSSDVVAWSNPLERGELPQR